eukprot:Skav205604  [mRNA]  locus=scaffold460:169469:170659:+ [translate_table: standard]
MYPWFMRSEETEHDRQHALSYVGTKFDFGNDEFARCDPWDKCQVGACHSWTRCELCTQALCAQCNAEVRRGSLGNVISALDQSSGQLFAVKEVLIDTSDAADVKFKEALENEVQICSKLKHPST